MAEHSGIDLVLKVSGAPTAMADEATTATGNLVYQITNAVKRVLDRDTPPTVEDGAVPTVEPYTVNYLSGKITFATATARTITITGKYLPMSVAAYANAYNRAEECNIFEGTPFATAYKTRVPGLKSMSGALTNLNVLDTVFNAALIAGIPIVIEDATISTEEPNRVWAMLEQSEIAAAVDGLQQQTVTWSSTDAWIKLGL